MSLQASNYALYGLEGADLNAQQRLVLILIADHVNGETGWAWMSIPRLAKYAGLSERGVQRALRGLRETGILEVIERPGKTNMYRICPPTGDTDGTTEHMSGDTRGTTDPPTGDTHGTTDPPTPATSVTSPDVPVVTLVTPSGATSVTRTLKNLNQEDDDDGARGAQNPPGIPDRVDLAGQIIPDTWADVAVVCTDPRLDVLDELTDRGWTARDLRVACAGLPRPRANPTGLLARHLAGLRDTDPDHIATRRRATAGTPRTECGHGVPTGGGCHDCDQETRPW